MAFERIEPVLRGVVPNHATNTLHFHQFEMVLLHRIQGLKVNETNKNEVAFSISQHLGFFQQSLLLTNKNEIPYESHACADIKTITQENVGIFFVIL